MTTSQPSTRPPAADMGSGGMLLVVDSADDTERARILFQEGNAAYRERNWQLAYDKFHEAFGLAPTYDLAGNLGDVELMLEKPREAAEHLAYSLKNWPAGQAEARAKTAARLKSNGNSGP